MKYLFAYPEKCTGCRECALACSLYKFGECNPKRAGITILRDEFERYEVPFVCLQCDEPECIAACMKGALSKSDGIVKLDSEKCIGCRMCVIACPYGAILSWKGEIIKCDLCEGAPVCVRFCVAKAILYEEETEELIKRRKELVAKIFKR